MMKRLKQGPVEQLKRRKCRLRNHRTSEVEQLGNHRLEHRQTRVNTTSPRMSEATILET
jgi:hypothetical protein